MVHQEGDQWEKIDQDIAMAVDPKATVPVLEERLQNPEKDFKQNANMEMNSSFFAQNKPPASEDSIKAAASASVLNGITRKESSNFKVGQTVDMDEMNTQCNLGADNQSFFYCRLVGDRWESASRYLCPFLFCSP